MWYVDQQTLRSACAYAQSDQSLCKSLEYSIVVKLLTEHHFEFLRLKGGCRGLSESTHVKMPHCWKSHALAQIIFQNKNNIGRIRVSICIGRQLQKLCIKALIKFWDQFVVSHQVL